MNVKIFFTKAKLSHLKTSFYKREVKETEKYFETMKVSTESAPYSSKSERIKKYIIELLSFSTAYGLQKLLHSKRLYQKLFWLAFLLSGSSMSLYLVWDAIDSYLDFETIVKINRVYEQPLLFPTVSFCPSIDNAFDGKSLRSLLNKCSFNLDNSCMKEPENFFELFTTFRGDCYRFNSGKNMSGHSISRLSSVIGGRDDSLNLNFNVKTELWIWIHEPSSPPELDIQYNYIGDTNFASNNSVTHLSVHKTDEKRLGFPYNKCYKNINDFPKNKTIIKYISSLNVTYKQVNCLKLCFDVYYINNNPCNCTNVTLGNVWRDCYKNSIYKKCTSKSRTKFLEGSSIKNCEEFCPLECDSVWYSVEQKSYINDQYEILYVYYESLKYTSISEVPKTKGFDLATNIGGIFGLFIGVSFVSLFEIGELLLEVIFLILERKKQRNLNVVVSF